MKDTSRGCAHLSLIFGIVGFFTVGFILGPMAIVYAHEAERAGARSTAGKVLGWILTTISVLGAIVVIAIAIAASTTYPY